MLKRLLRLAGYALAIMLMLLGIYGWYCELDRDAGPNPTGCVIASLLITYSLAICGAIRARYGAGLWFPIGLALLLMGAGWATRCVERLLHNQAPPIRITIRAIVLPLLAGICLFNGHLRHQYHRRPFP